MVMLAAVPQASRAASPLRAGIIGCDTSHVIAFTKLINDPKATGPLAEVEITCAYPGGSLDIPQSYDRVGPYTKQLREMGVEIVDSIAKLVEQSDVILVESLDGRPHLEQFRQAAKGKPVFIDKPAAGSLADLIALFKLAEKTKTPCFSASALRFGDTVVQLAKNEAVGDILGCSVASPFDMEQHHPDLFWYGIHGVESIYTLMGVGCESVSRVEGKPTTVVVGKWRDGRLATWTGLKVAHDYAFTVFGSKGVASASGFSGYEPHVRKMCEFFVTHKPPVSAEETLEMFAFMEAADESLKNDGRSVLLADVMKRAEEQAESK
jgi:predicted dehydrogenase